jgi:hypothetical protein
VKKAAKGKGNAVVEKRLRPGLRIAIGIAVCAMGMSVVVLSVYQLALKANKFAAGEFAALPVGMTVAFVGALLALPLSAVRTRALIGALMISALALTADWIAFGPGGPSITGNLGKPLQTSLMISRILFRVAAVLADLMALWAWVRFFLVFRGGAATRARPSS